MNWRVNPEAKPELDEFFAGKRKLWFVMISDQDFETAAFKYLKVNCHLVMKWYDGLVIPCWTNREAALLAAEKIKDYKHILSEMNEFAFSLSVQNCDPDLVMTAKRLHLVA